MEKAEETKRRRKRGKGGHLVLWVSLLAVYVIVNILAGQGSGVTTMPVRRGSEEELLRAEGYIFREQTVISAPAAGFLHAEVREDERVKSGEAVMAIYKSEINTQASSRLKQIDEKIAKLTDNVRRAEVFTNDSARLELEIAQLAKRVTRLAGKSSADGISDLREEIDSLIEKKRIISGEAVPNESADSELEALKAEKAQIEQENNIERTIVHAPKAGAFTARIDGMEELLSLDKVAELTPSYMKELDSHSIKTETAAQAAAGDAIGKIVNNYTWTAAAAVPAEDADELQVDDAVGIRFSAVGGDAADGTVVKISDEENGKVVLAVSTNKYIDSVYSTSKTEIEFVRGSYKGFRIPADSMRMSDGKKGVYVIRNGAARFIPVNVLYSGKEWIIVSEKKNDDSDRYLKIYDELIVSGKNLYDGKEVR